MDDWKDRQWAGLFDFRGFHATPFDVAGGQTTVIRNPAPQKSQLRAGRGA